VLATSPGRFHSAARARSIARLTLAVALAAFLLVGFLPRLAAVAATPSWLTRFNDWRASSGVPALVENTTWSAGDYNHALYMVQTGQVTHSESTLYPQYTTSGDLASRNSNIFVSSSTNTTDVQSIDWWMGAPFHAMGMMDPRLTTTGFGSYRNSGYTWQMGAAVDVGQGMYAAGQYPVYFPGNGATVPLTRYSGNESPDPTWACPGYTGLPLFVEVGGNVSTTVGPVHSFTGNGIALTHCVIDSTNTTFAGNLKWRGGVIVFPQAPLVPGVSYVVALTVNGAPYTWSFGVTNSGTFTFTPGAPTGVTATAGDATATVSWTPPVSTGGSPITSYSVTSYIGSTAQTTQPVLVPTTNTTFFGLNNGTTYTFTVTAFNQAGPGPSATSNAVTPQVPPVSSTKYLLYPARALGTTSSSQTVILTNGSAGTINVSAVNLSGVNAAEFTKGADTCTGQNVVATGTCTVQFTFTPTDNGVRNATVAFVDNGPDSPSSALVGVGGTTQAATRLWFTWYDNASPGVNADTIHVTNPSNALASGTISLGNATPITFNVGPGRDSYYAFPAGTIGGPVVINSTTVPVIAALRAWYYQSFNETAARSLANAATTLYLPWYDLSSPGMRADTIHITNVSALTATGTIALPGAATLNFSVATGQDSYFSFPGGTMGGPVTISSSQPVLATLRAWYYQSFNETSARPASAAATTQYFPWYDLQSAGMRADTIHITNESGGTATGTIALPNVNPVNFTVPSGHDAYFAFAGGTIGGPVTITSSQPVLASLRAWYYQSFNEVPGRPGSPGSTTQYFPWYDHFSPGVNADTIHITNPGGAAVTGTISRAGDNPINFNVAAGQDLYFAFPGGSIGGPVTITSTAPVLASLRAWYYQSFNEVPGSF
jgi:Fibronectin type III domain/Cysteine-rich secretory protein family